MPKLSKSALLQTTFTWIIQIIVPRLAKFFKNLSLKRQRFWERICPATNLITCHLITLIILGSLNFEEILASFVAQTFKKEWEGEREGERGRVRQEGRGRGIHHPLRWRGKKSYCPFKHFSTDSSFAFLFHFVMKVSAIGCWNFAIHCIGGTFSLL